MSELERMLRDEVSALRRMLGRYQHPRAKDERRSAFRWAARAHLSGHDAEECTCDDCLHARLVLLR